MAPERLAIAITVAAACLVGAAYLAHRPAAADAPAPSAQVPGVVTQPTTVTPTTSTPAPTVQPVQTAAPANLCGTLGEYHWDGSIFCAGIGDTGISASGQQMTGLLWGCVSSDPSPICQSLRTVGVACITGHDPTTPTALQVAVGDCLTAAEGTPAPSSPSSSGGACPATLDFSYTNTGGADRPMLRASLVGPSGRQTFVAQVDSGAGVVTLPNSVLQAAGFRPTGTQVWEGVVPGASSQVSVYDVPASDFEVRDGNRTVPLGSGATIQVNGIPGGTNWLLGPNLVQAGMRITLGVNSWTLTPPCG